MESNHFDVIVAGAGIAGITSAAAAASRGLKVALVSTGPGSFVLGAGCVEVQDQDMDRNTPSLDDAVKFFCNFTESAGCSFRGGVGEQHYIPTILGSFQTASLAPFYMWNGDPSEKRKTAVVGIKGLSSFDSKFVAERLAFHATQFKLGSDYTARDIELSTVHGTVPGTLQFANRYDRELHFREELRNALKPIAAQADVIILPGILGLRSGQEDIEWMEKQLGCLFCELATLPPSIPGMRLFNRLEGRLRKDGAELFMGFPIKQLQFEGRRFRRVLLDTPARPLELTSETLILATGPFSGQLLGTDICGFNASLHPVDSAGEVIAENLFAAGAILRKSSAQGGNAMAILTGYVGGMLAAGVGVQYAQR